MKKVSLLLILVFSTIAVSAQESGISSEAGRKATFVRNGFFDNWFIGAGAGANMYFGKEDSDAKLLSRPTLTGNGQVGKWFNPYLGARVKGTYGKIHTFSNNAKDMYTQKALTGEVDFLVDVTNYLGRYNENRFYSFIPYVGVGAAYGRGYERVGNRRHEKSLTFNGGLINKFRLTDKLALEIELSASLLKDDFDRRVGGDYAYDLLGNASANLVYKIGSKRTDFSEAVLMDQGRIDELNDEINKLKRLNDDLSKRPENCPKCPEVQPPSKIVEVRPGLGTSAVFFRIGSSNIDQNQEANIYNVAKYLNENPNAKVQVVGYADKKTGSTTYNERISERRAKKVADALINKHKIASSRINVQWKGDKVQPYSNNNAWNRVVIFVAE